MYSKCITHCSVTFELYAGVSMGKTCVYNVSSINMLHTNTQIIQTLCCVYGQLGCMFIVLAIYQDKKKKYEPPIPTRVGKKQKKTKGPDAANKLPQG